MECIFSPKPDIAMLLNRNIKIIKNLGKQVWLTCKPLEKRNLVYFWVSKFHCFTFCEDNNELLTTLDVLVVINTSKDKFLKKTHSSWTLLQVLTANITTSHFPNLKRGPKLFRFYETWVYNWCQILKRYCKTVFQYHESIFCMFGLSMC